MNPKNLKFYKEEEGRSEMKYIDVYYFEVMGELKKGNVVMVLDKQDMCVINVNTMRVADLLYLLECAEDKNKESRYYFFKREEEREDKEI